MRRLIYLLLLTIFVGASVSCVSASTDCERWFVAYRQQLAHSRQLQRVAAAKRRARFYARRKLAGYVKPTPAPHPALKHGPRMTPRQTLRHLDLACGILPEGEEAPPKVAEEVPPKFLPGLLLGDGVDLAPADLGDLIAQNDVPPPPFDTGTGNSDSPPGGFPVTYPPVGGGPGGYASPPGGGSTPPPLAPPAAVPEPSSIVFLLTGVLGAGGVIRRRFQL